MSEEPRLTHVRLLVEDYPAAFAFYRDVVGLEPTFGDAESGYADFDAGDVALALFDADEMAAAVDDGWGGAGRGQQTAPDRHRDQAAVVLRVGDVDETAATLGDRGADLAAPPTDHPEWGIRTVHCRDPEGTLLEFNEPLRE